MCCCVARTIRVLIVSTRPSISSLRLKRGPRRSAERNDAAATRNEAQSHPCRLLLLPSPIHVLLGCGLRASPHQPTAIALCLMNPPRPCTPSAAAASNAAAAVRGGTALITSRSPVRAQTTLAQVPPTPPQSDSTCRSNAIHILLRPHLFLPTLTACSILQLSEQSCCRRAPFPLYLCLSEQNNTISIPLSPRRKNIPSHTTKQAPSSRLISSPRRTGSDRTVVLSQDSAFERLLNPSEELRPPRCHSFLPPRAAISSLLGDVTALKSPADSHHLHQLHQPAALAARCLCISVSGPCLLPFCCHAVVALPAHQHLFRTFLFQQPACCRYKT